MGRGCSLIAGDQGVASRSCPVDGGSCSVRGHRRRVCSCGNCSPAKVFMGDTGACAWGDHRLSPSSRQGGALWAACPVKIGSVASGGYFRPQAAESSEIVRPLPHHLNVSGWPGRQVVRHGSSRHPGRDGVDQGAVETRRSSASSATQFFRCPPTIGRQERPHNRSARSTRRLIVTRILPPSAP